MLAGPGDVTAFAWTPDVRTLIVRTATAYDALDAKRRRAASLGFVADRPYEPGFDRGPRDDLASGAALWRVTLRAQQRSASIERASASDAQLLPGAPLRGPRIAGPAELDLVEPEIDAEYPARRVVALVDGKRVSCTLAACAGSIQAVWAAENTILFQRAEGHGAAVSALYAWRVRETSFASSAARKKSSMAARALALR